MPIVFVAFSAISIQIFFAIAVCSEFYPLIAVWILSLFAFVPTFIEHLKNPWFFV